jgi:hypothetical protein
MNTFDVPYIFNPGVLSGKLPNSLFKKIKKAVNDPSARSNRPMNDHLVGSIREEYTTPEVAGFREYLNEMYETWKTVFQTPNVPYQIDHIWTNYMKAGEFNPNHNHPNSLAVFVLWVTVPYKIEDEIAYNGYSNSMYPSKNSCFEFTYNQYDGRIINHPIYVDKSMEGTILMFPSTMIHCVYPFFTSNEERISIAGNINPV